MSSFFANEVAAIGSDPISQDAIALSGQNSEAPSSISSENILERGKRPPEMPLIQHSKEKCRRIAAQLQAKTDQFLQPPSQGGSRSKAVASSDSSLSSARTGEPLPLLPPVPSSSASSVLHDKLTSIMDTVKDFERKLQYFRDRVDSHPVLSTETPVSLTAENEHVAQSQGLRNGEEDSTTAVKGDSSLGSAHDFAEPLDGAHDGLHAVPPAIAPSVHTPVFVHTTVEPPVHASFPFIAPTVSSIAPHPDDESHVGPRAP